ncbi:hypothetical protein [Paragemmobacter straminiformis]|uniref:Uncharacterized protein n=1 Tax=Paragemmobacter straminiformis TaxID=2045119 RepID=A0A842I398_9RHOB|nr:hypothetical protein [Gemmobacter straminiformis]MBC2834360.1 hypothetical protein [Gemmobacter straminiformis]
MTFPADRAETIIRESLAHLLSLIGKKGRFVYAHKADDPAAASEGYNMLRHCGTLWFMLRAVAELDVTLTTAETKRLAAAIGYAGGKMQRPAWIAGPSYALVTKGMVKTGGIGLSLVMLIGWRDLAARRRLPAPELPAPLDDTVAGLVTYGLHQAEGGDFIHKRSIEDGTPTPFRSDYYTGEVLLGLICAEAPRDLVGPLTRGLMERGYGIDIQSHWMAYAACEAIERGYVDAAFGEAYVTRLVAHMAEHTEYRLRRASTPIACRTEALTRVLMLAKARGADCTLSAETLATARAEAETNLALQLDWYRNGQFLKSDEDDKVQIDYIQHNATSYLNWLAIG